MITKARVEEIHNVVQGDYGVLLARYLFLQGELDKLLGDTPLMMRLLRSENLRNKGKFRDELQSITQPYKDWEYPGRKAKNFRFITEQIRGLLLSLRNRQLISEHCQRHNWQFSQQLMEDLHEANLWPRHVEVKNICRAGTLPTIPTHKTFVMDWSTQDQENIHREEDCYRIQVDHTWMTVMIPEALRDKHKVCKPSFALHSDGFLYCTFSYEEEEERLDAPSGGVGANDWGKINPISCAAVYPDGSWTRQYLSTREGQHLHDVEQRLTRDIGRLCEKREAIGRLLAGRYDAHLYDKWCHLDHEIKVLRSKRSRVRDHACRVDARDVVEGFMLDANVDELHLEDLSDMDDSTREHMVGLGQEYIRRACERRGFACVMVGFALSSHTNPFTGERVDPGDDRLVVVDGDGHCLDRDHCAGLELCVRPAKRKRSESFREVGRPSVGCGDLLAGACRVRPVRRKGQHKKLMNVFGSSGSRRAKKLARREARVRVEQEREAFYERQGVRKTRQVFSGSGRCIAVTDTEWAKSPSGQLPIINPDYQNQNDQTMALSRIVT